MCSWYSLFQVLFSMAGREMDSNFQFRARRPGVFDGSLSSAPFNSLRVSTKTTRFLHEGPMVRIRLPPAESLSLGRIRFRRSRIPAFRAGVRGWLSDRVGRDAQGFPFRANRRQYLCRAIFQYRSAAGRREYHAGPNEVGPSPGSTCGRSVDL